jgi:hypothetical protein
MELTGGAGGFEFPVGRGYARPHPCPLPQERENGRPPYGI